VAHSKDAFFESLRAFKPAEAWIEIISTPNFETWKHAARMVFGIS